VGSVLTIYLFNSTIVEGTGPVPEAKRGMGQRAVDARAEIQGKKVSEHLTCDPSSGRSREGRGSCSKAALKRGGDWGYC